MTAEPKIWIFPHRREAGTAAATHIQAEVRRVLQHAPRCRVIFGCAPSQDDFFQALVRQAQAAPELWGRVQVFHMDDYVGREAIDLQSFRHYLGSHFLDHVPVEVFHAMRGEAKDPDKEAMRYAALLAEAPIDIICMGIGENGHVAFNDPAVADFDDAVLVKVVEMDAACRRQQVNDGCFPAINLVPRRALTITLPVFVRAGLLSCVVPTLRKAAAVRQALTGPIGSACPATVLRMHPRASLFLDQEAASLLPQDFQSIGRRLMILNERKRFFDLQVNGFAGVDFQQIELTAAELDSALRKLLDHSTHHILLTLITDRIGALCEKLARIERFRQESELASEMVVGYHLEGPYLRGEAGFNGVHSLRLMKSPEVDEFKCLWSASGKRLRLITLAPELPGAVEFIRCATGHGVRIAIGHSNAEGRSIDAAIAAGATLCTHLGNGVPLMLPRHDNIIQRLLGRDELYAAFIPDGLHLPAVVLKNFVRAKAPDKVLFTTDCMAAAGASPGTYRFAHLKMDVGSDGIVREPGKMNFAGSALSMDCAWENVCRFIGWTEAEALAACSTRVAEALGVRLH